MADYSIPEGRLFSWQYSWIKNHKPAKWTVTKVDTVAKTISGTFSFNATQAESNGDSDLGKRSTLIKVIEAEITDGEFHLPYKKSEL
ncbi:hypothetical protein [Pedobacter mucosus]|uniref:hypothetical protein n=1 Tax=Pedobacter mucosus TaxID=2895286 RepID=UPI001EE41433|nr:hypothetical protein [Pedobacter mucosus]UKT65644.1 hypothetical protein LOK61_07590 [Pedobacter mucosus]